MVDQEQPDSRELIIELTLPWPPTVNTYYRSIIQKGRPIVLLSKAGRQYKQTVDEIIEYRQCRALHPGRVKLEIVAHPPDRRKRDLDNLLKPLIDAIAGKGKIIQDDSQIDSLSIYRSPELKGEVDVRLTCRL